jgi:hypothetical protein
MVPGNARDPWWIRGQVLDRVVGRWTLGNNFTLGYLLEPLFWSGSIRPGFWIGPKVVWVLCYIVTFFAIIFQCVI